ncbi:MAG: dynamin family protein [Lachnospiraceae bacterium]|nr:dynamin family protein [Lachnospiraceae bacterium]
MERNKIKIRCNPYTKTISYQQWKTDENDVLGWYDLGNKSPLVLEEKYIHTSIQHSAIEIINRINGAYNRGGRGLTIVFEGTADDYHDIQNIIDRFFADKDVSLEKGEYSIRSAKEIMPEINAIFVNLANVFYDNESEVNRNYIKKYIEVTKETIPVCVTGVYSSGKSAFINALLGAEFLPSDTAPKTARIYRISMLEGAGRITFKNHIENIVLSFEDHKYKIEGELDSELFYNLCNQLDMKMDCDITEKLYISLGIINDYAKKGEDFISELVAVEIPYIKGKMNNSNYRFIFYDTPGSDADSHADHFELLKKALGDQTNGLPIVVTTPTDMDRGTKELLKELEKVNGQLDVADAMVVVNKSDQVNPEKLKNSNEETALFNWKNNRLFFVSSIIGLGGKKEDRDNESSWVDEDYSWTFDKEKNRFTQTNSSRYTQLYKYNRLPKSREENYALNIDSMEQNEANLLYINSGLHCIEEEILEFAEKYAMYNKCLQAQNYLAEAIKETGAELRAKEEEQKIVKSNIEANIGEVKQELIKQLKREITKSETFFQKDYVNYMHTQVGHLKQSTSDKIDLEVDSEWRRRKQGGGKEKVSNFISGMEHRFIKITKTMKDTLVTNSEEYVKKYTDDLKDRCCNIIKECQGLTQTEKETLEDIAANCPLVMAPVNNIEKDLNEISKHILVFRLDDLKQKKAKEMYEKDIEAELLTVNRKIIEAHGETAKGFSTELENLLLRELASMNPRLKKLEIKLNEIIHKIADLNEEKMELEDGKNKIEKMFEFKED